MVSFEHEMPVFEKAFPPGGDPDEQDESQGFSLSGDEDISEYDPRPGGSGTKSPTSKNPLPQGTKRKISGTGQGSPGTPGANPDPMFGTGEQEG